MARGLSHEFFRPPGSKLQGARTGWTTLAMTPSPGPTRSHWPGPGLTFWINAAARVTHVQEASCTELYCIQRGSTTGEIISSGFKAKSARVSTELRTSCRIHEVLTNNVEAVSPICCSTSPDRQIFPLPPQRPVLDAILPSFTVHGP